MRKPQRLPRPVLDSYEWQDEALCRHLPVRVFFDVDDPSGAVRTHAEQVAKGVCRRCPVIVACREHALAAEDYGIWGGLTAREREDIRNRRRRLAEAS
jgi:WhiB family redox-sensing transcriptional regulator